jgi:hypothetical protein
MSFLQCRVQATIGQQGPPTSSEPHCRPMRQGSHGASPGEVCELLRGPECYYEAVKGLGASCEILRGPECYYEVVKGPGASCEIV